MTEPTDNANGRPTRRPTPLWLDAVRRLERAVGVPVERALTSDQYFDMLPLLRRTQTQLAELVTSATDEWYRLFNIPAGSDVRRMREQISRMERQLEKLSKQLADREAADAAPSRARRKRDAPA
jgi:hypothetical protein